MYREVCAACHSLDRVAWRNLVGVSHTTSEAKEMAEEFEYDDEPDDQGNPKRDQVSWPTTFQVHMLTSRLLEPPTKVPYHLICH